MKSRILSWLVLILSLIAMAGLCVWNYFGNRRAVMRENQRWVARVSDKVLAERSSLCRWVDQLPTDPEVLGALSRSSPYLTGLVITDMKTHRHSRRWVQPSARTQLESLDPRLVALQFKAMNAHATQMGPVIFVAGVPQCTVVRVLDERHTLTAVIQARGILDLLEDESRF